VARYLGAHTVANGGISMAALRAGKAGMTALQIFTAPPQYYGDKATMKPDRVHRFRSALAQAGIAPERVVVHARAHRGPVPVVVAQVPDDVVGVRGGVLVVVQVGGVVHVRVFDG
jgi:hypothetical protein